MLHRSFDFRSSLYIKRCICVSVCVCVCVPQSTAIYLNGFTNSDFNHMRNNQELWPQDKKNMVRAKTSGVSLSAEGRDQRQPLLTHGQSSQFNTLHEEVSRLGCFFKRDLKPVQKLFQVWSWRLATDTYYNHFIRKRRAGIHLQRLCEVATEDVWKIFESWHCRDCWTWGGGQTCIWGQKPLECDRSAQNRTVTSLTDSSSFLKALGLCF